MRGKKDHLKDLDLRS